jgi:magnesium transporter
MADEQNPPKKQQSSAGLDKSVGQTRNKEPDGKAPITPVQVYKAVDMPPPELAKANEQNSKAPVCEPFAPAQNVSDSTVGGMITPVKLWQPDSDLKGNVKPYVPEQGCEPAERAFMVALRTNQPPLKLQANDPAEFMPYLNTTSLAWVNCRVKNLESEASGVAVSLGFSSNLVEALLKNRHSGYEDQESLLGMMLPAIRVEKLTVHGYKFLILMKDGLIFTIHGEEVVRLVRFARYAETFMRKIPVNIPMKDKLSLMLERILDENNERNFDGIRTIEEDSDEVGKMLSDPTTPMVKLSPIIYEMKHALITYLNMLWETQNVIHSLRYGDAELISDDPDLLERLEVISEDVTRHIQLGENLSEVLASGLEVLQGIYNNQLQIINNKMALVLTWMTILGTAFLVPNTIATAMGNTAYALKPSDAWWYSLMLILSMALSTWLSWWFLKRKGLLPEKID